MRNGALVVAALLAACTEPTVAPDAGSAWPMLLSETRLYADLASRTLAPSVIDFDVRYPLWADGASKQRYLLLPEGGQIDTSDMDRWGFPVGTCAWKEFRAGTVLVETRMLCKQADGAWVRVAYVWNEDGSDAVASPDGVANAHGTSHDVPSSDDCVTCHRGAHDTLLGVSAIQLTSESMARIADRLSAPPVSEPLVPGSGDVQQSLGYLHGNCAHCHNDDHPLAAFRQLRLRIPVGVQLPEETPTYLTTIDATMNHDIAGTVLGIVPGDPSQSQLYVRMGLRDGFEQMPPLATEAPDDAARAVISAWITNL